MTFTLVENCYSRLKKGDAKIAIIGLGYVGLPLALEFAKTFNVIGYDINFNKIQTLKERVDPNNELDSSDFIEKQIEFTHNPDDLTDICTYIIAVPTPVTRFNVPDLGPLQKASKLVGSKLNKDDLVIYESTVYPGCTEEDCIPILEEYSGLKFLEDFKVGYSPERINPGDKVHTLTNTVKIVSGCDCDSLKDISLLYESIIEAGVYKAESIKVAEAAKIVENTQRDLNIALMNELSMIFDRMGINTLNVINAAASKWNFLKFYPGLVGGHCIGVDPYYLTYKAIELGYTPEIILSGRKINDNLSQHVAKKTIQLISESTKTDQRSKVLVMGVTFKENVSDIRNSKVVDLAKELINYGLDVDVVDPYVDAEVLKEEYELELADQVGENYDCIIVAVKHKQYIDLTEHYFKAISKTDGALIDIKSQYLGKIKDLRYWTL